MEFPVVAEGCNLLCMHSKILHPAIITHRRIRYQVVRQRQWAAYGGKYKFNATN